MVKRARISTFYSTFVRDEWRWQSIWRRAGNAETALRPPATTWWLPVGGWTVVVRGRCGEPTPPAKSVRHEGQHTLGMW